MRRVWPDLLVPIIPQINYSLMNLKAAFFKGMLYFFVIFIIGCEKDTGELGENLVGDDGFIVEVRTDIPLVTYTMLRDSIASLFPSRLVIGHSNDPEFGQSSAGFVTQLRPESTNPLFGDNAVVDSVWLVLEYETPPHTGKLPMPLQIEVHRLREAIDLDREYYSTSEIEVEDQPLAVVSNFTPNFNRNVFVGDTNLRALVVPLDNDYFQELILSDTARQNQTTLDAFVEYIKGIRVRAVSGEGYVYFKLGSLTSGIRIFYSNDDTASQGLKQFRLQTHPDNRLFLQYAHDVSGSVAGQTQDTLQGMSETFVAGMSGPTTVVHFPDLSFLQDSISIINKCVIRFPIAAGAQARHRTPDELLAFLPGSLDRIRDFVGDLTWTNNGRIQRGEVRDGAYEVNVTFFLMNAFIKKEPLTFELLPVQFRSSARRTILAGSNTTQQPIEVVLYYTKPKQ